MASGQWQACRLSQPRLSGRVPQGDPGVQRLLATSRPSLSDPPEGHVPGRVQLEPAAVGGTGRLALPVRRLGVSSSGREAGRHPGTCAPAPASRPIMQLYLAK
jgi:hypothetical protein